VTDLDFVPLQGLYAYVICININKWNHKPLSAQSELYFA
jgi:hypothetical protein